MSKKKKSPPRRPPQKSTAGSARTKSASGSKKASQVSASGSSASRFSQATGQWARYLWAVVTSLLIAALLFEPTMLWCIGVGLAMLADAEFMGLWLVVAGYVMACVPWTFGLLIATGRFWLSLTHSLWIGILYSAAGLFFLDTILAVL